jgi:formylglycine-generating enzyme required for sulfatase activity
MCVNRGGGFATGARSARSSNRDPLKSDTIMGAVGVRPARALDGSP